MDNVEVVPTGQDQVVSLDVYLTDLDNGNEELATAVIVLHGPANTPGGVRFAPTIPMPLPSGAHPYVFRGVTTEEPFPVLMGFDVLGVTAGSIDPFGGADVSESSSGLFGVPVVVPAGTPPGLYPVVLDATFTDLSSAGVEEIITVVGPGGGVTVVPEAPMAMGAAAALTSAMLRRRRISKTKRGQVPPPDIRFPTRMTNPVAPRA